MRMRPCALILLSVGFLACTSKPSTSKSNPDETSDFQDAEQGAEDSRGPWVAPPPSIVADPPRLVAFADVHGDLSATRNVLKLAGLIDDDDVWSGGRTVVVQTGDQLDRGDDERAILDLFESLSEQAWAAGGAFYPLLGNHETMNVGLDFRYVTDGGWADFADVEYDPSDSQLLGYPEEQRGRVAAFRPGGPYAMLLSGHNLTMMVGDTVFVHGGILPVHARAGLQRINEDVQAWIRGESSEPNQWTHSDSSPVWNRGYSSGTGTSDCATLIETLEILGASRMVVGHTVQDAANPACDGQVWRLDVGMAAHYGGSPAAMQIEDGTVSLLQ
ncbi:MAG: calcineurin [Deltaproteobacteria bacterium]|nr:calcineurin [Deltaproteobacteria bacterium]